MNAAVADRLIDYLWPDGDLTTTPQVYALLDGARDQRIEGMVRWSRLEYCCLLGGRLAPALERAAPYLVHLAPAASFTRDLFTQGWGQSWGIITVVLPDCTLREQRRHFRGLLRVRVNDDRVVVFRFYDPRVLRAFLPTCTGSEAASLFGPVPRLLTESADGRRLLVHEPGLTGVGVHAVSLAP